MFFAVGVLCLIYYCVLCFSTRKIRSTFAWFWLVLGIVCLAGKIWMENIPTEVRSLIDFFVLILLAVFLGVEGMIILKSRSHVPEQVPYIIILGAQVRGKRVTDSLKRRLDVAYEYAEKNPQSILIVSGGQGRDEEISEARAMKSYLMEKGISSTRIFLEEESSSTYENLKNSQAFIEDMEEKVAIATNDFHIFRAVLLAKKLGYQQVFGLCASTKPVLKPNYMVREFFAVCKVWITRKDG